MFKGVYPGLKHIPKNYVQIPIRAHEEQEAYKKAQKQAESWDLELIPNKDGNLCWEQIVVKPRKPKPKNKHPVKPPELNEHELNALVKQIETAYRTTKYGWNNQRLGTLPAADVRKTIRNHKLGLVCRYCLVDFRGRYCSSEHSRYYRAITTSFRGPRQPWVDGKSRSGPLAVGDSIDHIKPISMGGLEFDKDNLQWMDLAENIRKGGINRLKQEQRKKIKQDLITAFLQAQALREAAGFGQRRIKYLKNN
jgi:hypothetical protein